jgi:hypothetical protein
VPEHELTTPQRNAVLEEVRKAGLLPEDFRWKQLPSSVTKAPPFSLSYEPLSVPVLIHVQTKAAFAFDLDSAHGHHYAVFNPGRQGPTEIINASDWGNEMFYVREWLALVKEEYETPDLWAEVGRERELVAPPSSDEEENTPFTHEEQAQIALQLGELKELLAAQYDLEGEKLEELEERIGYLERASRRLGRIDWRQILISQLFALVTRAVIPADAFHEAVQVLAHGIGHLFGSGPPQLPGGI